MNIYIELAKRAVESYITKKEILKVPDNLPEELLQKKSGAFITIEKKIEDKKKELRGCIGTYLPTRENIAKEIIHNAIGACTEDYRFAPIQKEELPSLLYTVYILETPDLVKDIQELDPKKYGIIVKTTPITYPGGTDVVFNGHFVPKSALLLPDLEGVNTIEQQIAITCQKGGIDPQKEKIIIYRFQVKKYQ